MRKILAVVTLLAFLLPNFALAESPGRSKSNYKEEIIEIQSNGEKDTFIDPDLDSAFVKDVPEDLKERLGEEYVLVRLDFLREIDFRAQQTFLLEEKVDMILADLDLHKQHIGTLENMLQDSYLHIDLLNEHIDAQDKVIKSLSPTWWDKNKFFFGMGAGVALTVLSVWAVDELDDNL